MSAPWLNCRLGLEQALPTAMVMVLLAAPCLQGGGAGRAQTVRGLISFVAIV
ncbi:hypothetical protein [Pseudomonas sp. MWU16-30317]|uniref:hypothetical protein n=1 Tax=Pseudomonas sp. MWU16-30317 TaxID=2878095 RepID=UPI001CF93402|nr:hypothetical protein [Pseudomonas sp. MWU16-30317]